MSYNDNGNMSRDTLGKYLPYDRKSSQNKYQPNSLLNEAPSPALRKSSIQKEAPQPPNQYNMTRRTQNVLGTGTAIPSNSIANNSNIRKLNSNPAPPANEPRTSKISNLQLQFEQLKKKIKDVQNKNEKIIERINQGRKGTDKELNNRSNDGINPSSNSFMNNKSDLHSREQILAVPQGYKNQNKHYTHNDYQEFMTTPDIIKSLQSQLQMQQSQALSPTLPTFNNPFNSMNDMPPLPKNSYVQKQPRSVSASQQVSDKKLAQMKEQLQLEKLAREECQRQVKILQDKLQVEEYKHTCLKNKFKNYVDCTKLILQQGVQVFMEQIMNTVSRIDKSTRRVSERLIVADNRLRRVYVLQQERKMQSSILPSQLRDVAADFETVRSSLVGTYNPALIKESKEFKEFEAFLQAKYEQLINTKNEQIEVLTGRLKYKEKQLLDMKASLDKLKEEKKMGDRMYQEKLAQQMEKSSQMARTQNRKSILDSSTDRRRSIASFSVENNRDNSVSKKQYDGDLSKKEQTVKQLQKKVAMLQKVIAQRSRYIDKLEQDVSTFKEKKAQLFREYHENLEANREAYKAKIDELTINIEELKVQLQRRTSQSKKLEQKERTTNQKFVESQIEVADLKRKLNTKNVIQDSSLNDSIIYSPVKETQSAGTIRSEQNIRDKELEKLNAQLQAEYERLSRENVTRLNQVISLENDVRKLQQKNVYLESQLKEMQISIAKQPTSEKWVERERYEQQVAELNLQISKLMKNADEQILLSRLRNENSTLHSSVHSLQREREEMKEELKRVQSLREQHTIKIKQLKSSIEELQGVISDLQRTVTEKESEVNEVRIEYQSQINNLESHFKMLDEQFKTNMKMSEKERQKLLNKITESGKREQDLQQEIKRLQGQKNILTDSSKETTALRNRLKEMEKQIESSTQVDNKIVEEYKAHISKLQEDLETITNEKVKFQEMSKFQSTKIEELEMELFSGKQDLDDSISVMSHSDLKAESLLRKIKTLEKQIIQKDVNVANLERHLRSAEQNNIKLMNEVNELFIELENKKMEFNRTLGSYEERILQQQTLARSLEKTLREKQEMQLMKKTSLNFSMHQSILHETSHIVEDEESYLDASQIEGMLELDTSVNYDRIRLRRKDQANLVRKTMQYVRGLRKTIEQRNKTIRILNKRIDALKNVTTLLPGQKVRDENVFDEFEDENNDDDAMSMKSMGHTQKYKDKRDYEKKRKLLQMKDEARLILEENNLLQKQIEGLQEEVEKAETQEEAFLSMKEVYKQEIQSLRMELDKKETAYREQIKKLESMVTENQTLHNLQTIKQLVVKVFTLLVDTGRRENQRAVLQEYMKVLTNILKLDPTVKDRLMHNIIK